MKLKITRNFEWDIHDQEEKEEIKTFKEGEIHEVIILWEYDNKVDIQFGNGSEAYSFPKNGFEVI